MRQVFPFLCLLILLGSCTSDQDEIPIEGIEFSFDITRLDQEMGNIKSEEDALAYANKVPTYLEWVQANAYPNDSIYAREMFNRAINPGFQKFYDQGKPVRDKFSQTVVEFENTVKRVKHFYPEFNPPALVTTFEGYTMPSMTLKDSLYSIGLDYFSQDAISPEFKLKGDAPQYITRYYSLDYLPTKFAQGIASKFNEFDEEDNSLVSYMVYYGKELYFMEKVCPGKADSVYIEYSAEEIESVQLFEESIIWPKMLNYLYGTDPTDRSRLIQPAPNCPMIADKCPGRIGRYIGWQIVRTYMEKHKELTLRDLMKEKDALKIFKQSGYKPTPPKV